MESVIRKLQDNSPRRQNYKVLVQNTRSVSLSKPAWLSSWQGRLIWPICTGKKTHSVAAVIINSDKYIFSQNLLRTAPHYKRMESVRPKIHSKLFARRAHKVQCPQRLFFKKKIRLQRKWLSIITLIQLKIITFHSHWNQWNELIFF